MKGERRIRRLVASIEYKPGSTFRVKNSRDRKYMTLHIEVPVINSDPPHAPYMVDGNWRIDPEWVGNQTDEDILAGFMCCVAQLELHEVYEHYKIDGRRFREPHPDGKQTGKFPYTLSDAFIKEIMGDTL